MTPMDIAVEGKNTDIQQLLSPEEVSVWQFTAVQYILSVTFQLASAKWKDVIYKFNQKTLPEV